MTSRNLQRRTAAGLTLLTLGAVLSGCTSGAAPEATAPSSAATGSQAAPGPTAPASSAAQSPAGSAAPAASGWTALQDSAPFKALTPEQQQKISTLEAMDMATFQQQSRDDQLAYGAFLREVYQDYAIAGMAAIAPGSQLPAPEKVPSSGTGAQIMGDDQLKAATARWSVQPDAAFAATTPAADNNYTKMAPSRVSPLLTTAYADASRPAALSKDNVLAAVSESQGTQIVNESNNFIPFDGSWEELTFKIVEMQNTETQARNQLYFAYTPFTDIHGAKDGVWILMYNAQEGQEKWIPDLNVID
ncbi:hypothetical protein [Arthrobacter sp. EPSL27]|uniref:hypothetical protein n=1 Tax=Arthrobacter sp. EPSL27 TaxID=1745378 RepID=UPI0007478668|nr:hypothetical protein [Arthrobacter sp. EPSL27]KUM36888.1 hypothetical protein AR539_05930 [Arthrobacter sp. EPSL27]